jgi:drug/metabolite transporter (DMT)-like permease
MTPSPQHHHRAVAWMLAGSVSFTAMSALSHDLSHRVHWSLVASSRTIVALMLAAALARLGGAPVMIGKPQALWLRSVFGSLSLVTSFLALASLPLGTALTLFNLQPLWILIFHAAVDRLPIRRADLLAIASGGVGVVMILQPHFGAETSGSLSAIASSLFAAVAMMGLNRLGRLDPRSVVVHFSAVSSVAAVSAWLLLEGQADSLRAVTSGQVMLLVGVGIFGMVGQLMLTRAYGSGRAPTVAAAGMSQVAFGAIVDYCVFDHLLDVVTLAGMILILAPSLWELTHPLRRATARGSSQDA